MTSSATRAGPDFSKRKPFMAAAETMAGARIFCNLANVELRMFTGELITRQFADGRRSFGEDAKNNAGLRVSSVPVGRGNLMNRGNVVSGGCGLKRHFAYEVKKLFSSGDRSAGAGEKSRGAKTPVRERRPKFFPSWM
jgi:hypothetical protein